MWRDAAPRRCATADSRPHRRCPRAAQWPTNTTLPNGQRYTYAIHNSGSPGANVVASFLAACRLFGVRPAFYYSIATNTFLNVQSHAVQTPPQYPLQAGQFNVTQAQYWDLTLAQLEELWTTYGGDEIFEVWVSVAGPTGGGEGEGGGAGATA